MAPELSRRKLLCWSLTSAFSAVAGCGSNPRTHESTTATATSSETVTSTGTVGGSIEDLSVLNERSEPVRVTVTIRPHSGDADLFSNEFRLPSSSSRDSTRVFESIAQMDDRCTITVTVIDGPSGQYDYSGDTGSGSRGLVVFVYPDRIAFREITS